MKNNFFTQCTDTTCPNNSTSGTKTGAYKVRV